MLYRKYRSQSFAEVIGQDHIVTALNNSLSGGHVSHAYLFTGPRGVGKTSVARILAHRLNNFDYPSDIPYLDIIEIDAASNRRIDEVRDLREKARMLPVKAKYKVYIIDEVHMLTREAFNALLKTLEEPPAHVVFILATTEAHKLPETIISRTQRFVFRPIPDSKVAQHLSSIAKKEKIDIDNDAIELIAGHGAGSFRDSLSLLDQTRGLASPVKLSDVQQLLGVTEESTILQIIDCIETGNLRQLGDLLSQLVDYGTNSTQVAQQLMSRLRTQLIEDDTSSLGPEIILPLLKNLLDVPSSPQPSRLLELVLIEAALSANKPKQIIETPPQSQKTKPPIPYKERPKIAKDTPAKNTKAKVVSPANTPISSEDWTKILSEIKKRRNTLYGILRMGEPTIENDKITIAFKFPFHKRQIAESKNSQLIVSVIREITGTEIQLKCITVPNSATPINQEEQDAPPIETISNIFGSAEVLDS